MAGDWEAEYGALKKGNPLYLRSLAQYLEHFAGRTAVPVTAFGPPQADQNVVWAVLTHALGLAKDVHEAARCTRAGPPQGSRKGARSKELSRRPEGAPR